MIRVDQALFLRRKASAALWCWNINNRFFFIRRLLQSTATLDWGKRIKKQKSLKIKGFRACGLIKVSTDEVSLEGRELLFLKSSSICTSSCVFHAFSPPAFITVLPHLGLLCHHIHSFLWFLPPSPYSRFLPSSLVPFIFQSLNYPWEQGHPVQGGFLGEDEARWEMSRSAFLFVPPFFSS